MGSQTTVPACLSACIRTSGVSLRKSAAVVLRCGQHSLARAVADVVAALVHRHDAVGDLPAVQAFSSARPMYWVMASMKLAAVL